MKKRRIKKQVYYILGLIIFFIIAIIGLTKYIKYINSNEYKLEKLGYDKEQVEIILNLNENEIKDILSREYNKTIVSFIKQKYFIYKNLNRYLEYYKKNKNDKISHIVSVVNVNADYEFYDEDIVKETDISLGNLMLVNKFNHLSESFEPENIVDVNLTYAYENNRISEEVMNAFKNMWGAAKEKDLNLIINSSYRNYKEQEDAWNWYDYNYDEEKADKFAARPGYSEHQTGLSIDISAYKKGDYDFEETDEFKWLEKNSYKYGFILRYPKGKEDITGYDYESWHYRYVGVDVAKQIYDEDITFDEYYAYYIEK